MKYAIVEISGRQYKVEPGKDFKVDFLGEDATDFESEKVLLLVDDKGTLSVGEPFLKQTLKFTVKSFGKEKKIRVAKYHAKANTRKVTGSRKQYTLVTVA